MRRSLLFVVVTAVLSTGCQASSDGDGDGGADAGECVAQEFTFNGFHSWAHATAMAPPGMEGNDGLHSTGPLEVYWNPAPPHGSTAFPLCTAIVKEPQGAAVGSTSTFAMVKRGGGFNTGTDVATGWEWFALIDQADGSVMIEWRGIAAIGQPYSNMAIGNCNGCHSMAGDNDFVWDTALTLTKF